MFREMARRKQALSEEECAALLTRETRGVLCVLGEGGYPYGVPHNHYYDPATGRLYFHSGKKGHKVDALRASDKVSYTVVEAGEKTPGDWAYTVRSVIVFGRLRPVEDSRRAMDLCRALSHKFTDDEAYIEKEVRESGPGTLVYELIPEHITGKRVHEA
ncbi:MAG: pyridoxamine 5'-phosphate oxidase family protein [bacterium]